MKKSVLFFLFLFFLILLTRIQLLWEAYFHADEALFALSAKIWQLGERPYVDWFETKPLGVYLFYSLPFRLLGGTAETGMRGVHILSLLWTFLTAVTIGRIAGRLSSQKIGFMAAIFFVLFSTFWDPDIISVSIEAVLLLPLCLSIAMLLPATSSLRLSQSFASGLFAATAFLCKYQAGILLPVVLIYYGPILWKAFPEWRLKKALTHSLVFALGFLPLPVIMIGYLARIGALQDFLFWNILGNFDYIRAGTAFVPWRHSVTQMGRYLASTILIWVLTAVRFFRFRRDPKNPSESLVWIWFFLSFIPVSTGFRFEDHYFLFLTPILSILASLALHQGTENSWRRWRAVIVVAVVLPSIGFTVTRYFMHPLKARLDGEDIASYKPYGTYLKERTSSGDRIFIWGAAPAIYLYADRLPATRFLRTDNLAGRLSGFTLPPDRPFDSQAAVIPGTWEMFFEDVHRHPPVYIVDTAPTGLHDFRNYPMTQYPQLMDYVGKYYVREPDFLGATVYRRQEVLRKTS